MKEEGFDDDYLLPQKRRYFRRQREAREVTQWTGSNIVEIVHLTHMAATLVSDWVYLRCMISGALLHTVPPKGWVFYGEDDRLRVEDDMKFKSKYEVK